MGDDLAAITDVEKKECCKGSVGRAAPCTSAAAFCLQVYNIH